MSRTYALALIFTALTLIGGAFYGQYRYLTDGRVEASEFEQGVYERVMAGQLEEMRILASIADERTTDDAKSRFRPILPFINDAFERRDRYLTKVEAVGALEEEGSAEFYNFHLHQLKILLSAYHSFLREFGHQMDLRDRDIEMKVENMEKAFRSFGGMDATGRANPPAKLLALDYLEAVRGVVRDVVEISGGSALNCFPPPNYYPVINHGFSDPKLGETITTTVSIGKLDYSHRPEEMFVLINGDTLKMDNYWQEPYTFKPRRRGKQVLEMELYVRNPLTGEARRQRVNHYSYHVR